MDCQRCGKASTVSLGTTPSGEWFKCESCGHVFVVKAKQEVEASE